MGTLRIAAIAAVCGACSAGGGDPASAPAPRKTPAPAPAPPAPVAAAEPPADRCADFFDPPAGATKLCDEHVMGEGAEINWTSWAVATSRWDTFTVYQTRARECGASTVSKPPILSISKDETRLSVHDKDEPGYPSCASKPGAGDRSVVVISTRRIR